MEPSSSDRRPSGLAWAFPDPDTADESGLVAIGADLEPETLLAAYQHGYFPMPIDDAGTLGWWSPSPRGILELDDLRISRSLERSMRRFDVTVDTCFDDVVAGCADPSRPLGWITEDFRRAYGELHRRGWAHSVEVWHDGALAGGLYGVGIGAFFAGESMFHRVSDASKAAVAATVELLRQTTDALFDVQWRTPHLASLGVTEMERSDYLERLSRALVAPSPAWGL